MLTDKENIMIMIIEIYNDIVYHIIYHITQYY
jgi:hypothetical protein